MEFLETIETIKKEEASIQRLFNSKEDGQSVRGGYKSPKYMKKLVEAITFINEVYRGKRPVRHLVEALTTSDFPQLFGDTLDRQLLAEYKATLPVYRNFTKVSTVPDFRTVKRFAIDGGDSTLDIVHESEEYPEDSIADSEYTYSVKKYGRRIPLSWETLINDDLEALKDIPRRFARAAVRTESKFVAELYCDANGPDDAWMTNVGTAPLTMANLGAALDTLATNAVDTGSEPILIEAVHLVVPPALMVTAKNIMNSIESRINEDGGSTNTQLIVNNWMKNQLKLSIDPYIPIIASSSNGNTSWFLFADPNNGRPAMEVGFLRGHESPEIFMKSPNAERVGGGNADAMGGDFDTDSVQYKVRHVIGGTEIDPLMCYGSDGSA